MQPRDFGSGMHQTVTLMFFGEPETIPPRRVLAVRLTCEEWHIKWSVVVSEVNSHKLLNDLRSEPIWTQWLHTLGTG